jgi:hypothetical protein
MAEQETQRHTDAGRVLHQQALVDVLTHIAVGSGAVPILGGTLQVPARTSSVVGELGRARIAEKHFVVPDSAGALITPDGRWTAVTTPTNQVYLRALFLEGQAQGNWRQLGLYGGVGGDAVSYLERGATLLDVGGLAGDDRANAQVLLSGAYSPGASQRITVTVTTGGGSGVGVVGWVSSGSVASGSATVTFGAAVTIPGSGLALTFSGGIDGVLTLGAQWEIRGTRSAESATFAAGGLYHPLTNPAGQVKVAGQCAATIYRDPPFVKVAAAIDVPLIYEVLRVE